MKNTNKYKNKLRMVFMLLILCLPVAAPIALVATRAIPAQAQQQGGASQILMQLFMSLLSSLISMAGGGNTPQSGPAEEQVPMMGSINPTRYGQPKYGYSNYPTTGSYSDTNSSNSSASNNNSIETKVFLTDINGALSFIPSTALISSGNWISIQNNTSSSQTIKIKNSSSTVSENQVSANSSIPFKLVTAGSYSVCAGQIEICGLTLTVN